ncbi:MAG: hypothetical protein VKL59_08650 [Nostocaceae cyanobacterium]|nr:hypothetical protein [Nostocaceae cyanobacterium]
MAKTPIALYRQGNAHSSRMDNVRPNKDVATYEDNGQVWVMTTLTDGKSLGGVSTFATPGYGKNWWKLEPGADIPDELELVNDHDNHWLWKPSKTMPIDEYKAALRKIGTSFYKVS